MMKIAHRLFSQSLRPAAFGVSRLGGNVIVMKNAHHTASSEQSPEKVSMLFVCSQTAKMAV